MGDDEAIPEGDPVCWLARVCDECGAFVEAETCWRCSAGDRRGAR